MSSFSSSFSLSSSFTSLRSQELNYTRSSVFYTILVAAKQSFQISKSPFKVDIVSLLNTRAKYSSLSINYFGYFIRTQFIVIFSPFSYSLQRGSSIPRTPILYRKARKPTFLVRSQITSDDYILRIRVSLQIAFSLSRGQSLLL